MVPQMFLDNVKKNQNQINCSDYSNR